MLFPQSCILSYVWIQDYSGIYQNFRTPLASHNVAACEVPNVPQAPNEPQSAHGLRPGPVLVLKDDGGDS